MIGIEINKAQRDRWLRAVDRVIRHFRFYSMEMQRKCAFDYYRLVARNILSRQRPRPPYHPWYRSWKMMYGRLGYPSPWRLGGDLITNLTARQVRDGWVSGILPGVMDSGGKSWFGKGDRGPSKEIAMYGWIEEQRRPLFRPTMEEYASSEWLNRGEEALRKIGNAWR